VILSPIPCWAHLPPDVYRQRIATLVKGIESEAALSRSLQGASVLGVDAILAKDPQHRPVSLVRSPAPLVHAATKAARKAFYDAYAWFVAAFRQAAEKLRQGDRNAVFPAGKLPACSAVRSGIVFSSALFVSRTTPPEGHLPSSRSSQGEVYPDRPTRLSKQTLQTRFWSL
jgi:hypothetical protein